MAMTVERAHERIKAYFSREGADFAMDEKAGVCKYRIKRDGRIRKCAVGCLIPKRDYKPVYDALETHVDSVLTAMGVGKDSQLAGFLKTVQGYHDECAFDKKDMAHFLVKLDSALAEYSVERAA